MLENEADFLSARAGQLISLFFLGKESVVRKSRVVFKALGVLRYCCPFCAGPGDDFVDEDRQKAALAALEKGRITADAIAFVREQADREWEIYKDNIQPDGYTSDAQRELAMETASTAMERYYMLADELENLQKRA
ncbi:MAG: hypothetical protein Q8Q48_03500 [Candidatus Staskawiczbacteria bacterium]|nr:hypothetical protein [Candidatus Staskawiczbacteria bacterium]